MSRIKSNPEYTKLAYKKTVMEQVVCFLTTNFTAAYGDPLKKMRCEEVFQDEAEIPAQFISEFVADQNKLIHRIEDDLASYVLEKRKYHDEEQPEESAKPSPQVAQGKADAGKHGHHRQGATRKRAAAAQ